MSDAAGTATDSGPCLADPLEEAERLIEAGEAAGCRCARPAGSAWR